MPASSEVPRETKAMTSARENHFFITLTPKYMCRWYCLVLMQTHSAKPDRGNLIHIAYALRNPYGRQNVLLWKHGIGFTV
jgi:hypothetical protein